MSSYEGRRIDELEARIRKLESSLEKEKEGHIDTIDQLDKAAGKHLNNLSKIADLEVALEKEREQTDHFRLETNRLTDELAKEKERVEAMEEQIGLDIISLAQEKERVAFWVESYDEELAHSKQAEKRLESERISVNELSLANQELMEKVRKLEYIMTCDPDHWDTAYVNWVTERFEERIKELETQLASIKDDESIGRLEVEGEFGENE